MTYKEAYIAERNILKAMVRSLNVKIANNEDVDGIALVELKKCLNRMMDRERAITD